MQNFETMHIVQFISYNYLYLNFNTFMNIFIERTDYISAFIIKQMYVHVEEPCYVSSFTIRLL